MENPVQRQIQVHKGQLTDFRQVFGLIPAGFYIIRHINNLVQKGHVGFSRCMV